MWISRKKRLVGLKPQITTRYESAKSALRWKMVSLKLQKRLAASVLKCGTRKIWMDPNEVRDSLIRTQRRTAFRDRPYRVVLPPGSSIRYSQDVLLTMRVMMSSVNIFRMATAYSLSNAFSLQTKCLRLTFRVSDPVPDHGPQISEISMANSRQNIRKLVKDGFVIRQPHKVISRIYHDICTGELYAMEAPLFRAKKSSELSSWAIFFLLSDPFPSTHNERPRCQAPGTPYRIRWVECGSYFFVFYSSKRFATTYGTLQVSEGVLAKPACRRKYSGSAVTASSVVFWRSESPHRSITFPPYFYLTSTSYFYCIF